MANNSACLGTVNPPSRSSPVDSQNLERGWPSDKRLASTSVAIASRNPRKFALPLTRDAFLGPL